MSEERENHCYLGDGVYVEKNDDEIILRTGDHRDTHCDNKIYLENNVLENLILFLKKYENKPCKHEDTSLVHLDQLGLLTVCKKCSIAIQG